MTATPVQHDLTLARQEIDRLREENARLREAGGFIFGWHPTDPEHPGFNETHEYGTAMMLVLLGDEPYSDARVMEVFEKLLAERDALKGPS